MRPAASFAPVATDPLADRLRQLRAGRDDDSWPELLLDIGRDLTMAKAGAIIAGDPPVVIAPREGIDGIPDDWQAAAARAQLARGVWAGPSGAHWIFAAPVGHTGPITAPRVSAVVVLEIATRLQMDLALTRERLVTLAVLAETITQAAAGSRAVGAALAAEAVEGMLGASDRDAGLAEAASTLARRVPGVERLALARISSGRVTALHLADQPTTDRAGDLPRLLAGLVEEAVDAPNLVQVAGDAPPTLAQAAFTSRFGQRPLLAIVAPGRRLGLAVTLNPERVPTDTAALFAPALALLERVIDPRPPRFAVATRRRWLARAAVVAAVPAVLAVWPRADVVEAPATLQPEWQQVVSAPFDGVVETSTVQPGDGVEANTTILARLVTREIELEIAAARARASNELREATVARAAGQPAQEQLALLSAARAQAQLDLLEHRLSVADLRSPRSGIVASGDLRRSLGQPVLRGQTLFDIAPQVSTRAEIRVLDEDITRVAPGQVVQIMPAAEPGVPRRATVERIRPVAEVVQMRNAFLVVAQLDPAAAPLRPGSEGIAHIETGRTNWLDWLTRRPVRYVRRLLWL